MLHKEGDMTRVVYFCSGRDGQFIFNIPSRELVLVRTGFSKESEYEQNKFIAGNLDAIK
jgi:hypothetical protein